MGEKEERKRWFQAYKLLTRKTRPEIKAWLMRQECSEYRDDMRRRLNVMSKNQERSKNANQKSSGKGKNRK